MPQKSLKSEDQVIEKDAKKDAKKFAFDVKKQVVTAWTAALGLVLAIAWNTVFQSVFKSITDTLFSSAPEFLAPVLSACLTTILVVLGIIILNKWAEKPPKTPN